MAKPVTDPTLYSYIDESADEQRKATFCVGAFLVNEQNCRAIQTAWVKRLERDGIAYFRASDCKAVKGPFGPLRKRCGSLLLAREAAATIRADLEDILISSSWIGFSIAVDMPEYTAVRNAVSETTMFYSDDPTVAAVTQSIYTVARAARKNAPGERVSFIVDDSTYSGRIMDAFKALKLHHPVIAKTIASIRTADDKVTPALQIADLLASVVKEAFLKFKDAGEPFSEKWSDHFESLAIWDGEHTLRALAATIRSKRFQAGTLVRQPQPPPSKRQIKMARRAAVLKEQRNRGC